jgi:hypothetical protein
MIEKPKKERRFLKTLGRVGEILLQEVLIKVGSSLIKRIGGKKTLPSILFLFLSISLFAQFPNTGNKQRLGFQTTADGLVWRGSISDTASIQPLNNQNAWVILDTVNLKIYSFDFTSNVWNALAGGTTIDTTSLSNRINLKVNISDTAAMLLPYFRDADTSTLNLISRFALKLNISDTASMLANYASKAYADTSGRFYARQDFTNVLSSTLTWTQTDTLVVGGTGVVQVYRNGQILLPTQYTIPTKTTVVIGATAYKLGENYTVIFPRGGGASGSGGSGSLTSISGGTGITVSPNPITTTGTVSADLSVLMELTDTTLLNLSSRFATKLNISDTSTMLSNYNSRINLKLNISDTAAMLAPYFRDTDTSSLNLTSRIALKLNSLDTASLSNRINAKGNGTVTSIGSGFGLLGGTITTSGTLRLDSAVVFTRIRDSIVDVAIGNDTIKILKQEYSPATTSVLTWTITSKFPIQLKSYILVFRNGQLLNNDQFNLTDTNKITIVSTSFKLGANYTVATVSGIGSVGTGVFSNPVYPEAGIALSTGTMWASSITNNSSSWNIAFNDKINNAVFSGTDTKTLTLTQYDGGTFAPTFTDLQGVTGVTAGTGLTGGTITTTGTVAADTSFLFTQSDTLSLNLTSRFAAKQNTLTNPVTGTGTTNTLPLFTGTSTLGNSVIQESSSNIGINTTPYASLTLGQGKNIMLDASSNNVPRILFYETNARNENDVQFGAKIQYNSPSDRLEFVMRDSFSADPSGDELAISIVRQTGNTTIHKDLTVSGNITEGGNNVLTNLDTASLSSRIDLKLNKTDTASLSSRIDAINSGGNQIAANNNTSQTISNLTGISNYYLGITSNSTVTITLPSVSINVNKMITIKNTGTGAVNSASSNVQPLKDPAPPNTLVNTSEILISGGGKWTTMVSNGYEWVKMAGN